MTTQAEALPGRSELIQPGTMTDQADSFSDLDPSRRLEELIHGLDREPENVRMLAEECIRAVLALHQTGLARILQLVQETMPGGKPVLDVLLRDECVRSLLLIHELHPQSLETRLQQALETVRPYMRSHGGDVELVSLENGVARLRFDGACHSCPSSAMTMEHAIRRAVEETCPDLAGLELEKSGEGI